MSYHHDIDKDEARREEAAHIAMDLTSAASSSGYVSGDPLNFFQNAAVVVDRFLQGTLNIEAPSNLLITGIPEEVAQFISKALANRHPQ